jgi:hypothetical protein
MRWNLSEESVMFNMTAIYDGTCLGNFLLENGFTANDTVKRKYYG